jgi:cyclophilin family peptidyl-prolyl cis-trans isomerase
LLQAVVVCIIFYLVYDAHIKVKEAAHRLEHYKYEEAMLIDQMDRIEGRAMQLQEQLRRLRQINGEDSSESELAKTKLEAHTVEKDVFHWKRHFFEINKEVHALQDFMQDKARQDISSRYGSGTIQVNLNLATEEEGAPSQVTLELFDETPHAAWTFLQQIEKGDWKGASFIWHPSHMVLASPTKASSRKIEFVEKSHYEHEAWTVGLTPVVGGRYNLYINLQDNSHVHDGDVCLGKVVGGFDSLQQVLKAKTVAKQQGGDKTYLEKPIVINTMAISIVKRYGRRR